MCCLHCNMHHCSCSLGSVPPGYCELVSTGCGCSEKSKQMLTSSNRPLTILIYSNGKQLQYLHLHYRAPQPFDKNDCMGAFYKNEGCMPPSPFWKVFPTNPLPPSFFFSLWKEHFYENYQKQPFLAGFLYSPVDKTGLVLKEQLGFLGYACMGAKWKWFSVR